MAISILSPSGSNLDQTDLSRTSSFTPLTFSRANDITSVYCNHPELLGEHYNDFYGDYNLGNKFLNQVTVKTPSALVFASYHNKTNSSFTFGIQIFNPTANVVKITPRNNGFSTASWDSMPVDVWDKFFSSASKNAISLGKNGSYWIMEKTVPAGAIFNALQLFDTTGEVIVTVYAYKNKNNLNGTATAIPQSGCDQVSGYGDTAFLICEETIKASTLTSKDICHRLFNINSGNINEAVPIHTVQGRTENRDGYIGNWGVQYYFTVTLKNDTDSPFTFNGYLGANNAGTCMCVQSGSSFDGYFMHGKSQIKDYPNYRSRWHWLSHTVPKGTSQTITFQITHGSNGCAPGYMQWSRA